jgi:hypothetical protein
LCISIEGISRDILKAKFLEEGLVLAKQERKHSPGRVIAGLMCEKWACYWGNLPVHIKAISNEPPILKVLRVRDLSVTVTEVISSIASYAPPLIVIPTKFTHVDGFLPPPLSFVPDS